MPPTPEQLNNRKLLSADILKYLDSGLLVASDTGYIYEPNHVKDGETCQVCAVGALLVVDALRDHSLVARRHRERVNALYQRRGLAEHTGYTRTDMHVAFMHLTGMTLVEMAAFEAAFMGHVYLPSVGALRFAHSQGYADLTRYLDATGDPIGDRIRSMLDVQGLVQDACNWYGAWGSNKDRLQALAVLLDRWAAEPVAFPQLRVTQAREGQ